MLSKPRKNNIIKKIIAQNCGKGSIPIASGYVIKARDGPPVTTEDTGKPVISNDTKIYLESEHQLMQTEQLNLIFCSRDMNPNTEKTTKPAKILVPQFTIGTMIASLPIHTNS